eukprot:117132-Chlamydomonas_euryale.AAC.11
MAAAAASDTGVADAAAVCTAGTAAAAVAAAAAGAAAAAAAATAAAVELASAHRGASGAPRPRRQVCQDVQRARVVRDKVLKPWHTRLDAAWRRARRRPRTQQVDLRRRLRARVKVWGGVWMCGWLVVGGAMWGLFLFTSSGRPTMTTAGKD